jgi:hypothetical protein
VVGEPRVSASALARSEMAREKARIGRVKPDRSSRLRQVAEGWKVRQEQRERLRFSPEPEISVVAPVRMPLRATVGRTDETLGWRPRRWRDEQGATAVLLNAATLSRIAQHLKAREWARAMGKRLSTPLGFGLEEWAETWRRNKELEERRLAGPPAAQDRRRPA